MPPLSNPIRKSESMRSPLTTPIFVWLQPCWSDKPGNISVAWSLMGSEYLVNTPGLVLSGPGSSEFRIRVEADGRSAVLVSFGTVVVEAEGTTADVPRRFWRPLSSW